MGTTNGPYLYYCAVPRGSLNLLFLQVKRKKTWVAARPDTREKTGKKRTVLAPPNAEIPLYNIGPESQGQAQSIY